MEPQHLRQHGRVAAAPVAQARGQAGQAAVPGVAEPAARARHRHAHLRALDGHAKLAEEPGEQRVRAPVVHDEAGVEEDIRAVGAGQLVGVRVPAEPVRAVEEHDIVAASEHVAGREAGDAAAHDGDFAPGHSAPWVLACGWVCAWFELRPGSGLVAGRRGGGLLRVPGPVVRSPTARRYPDVRRESSCFGAGSLASGTSGPRAEQAPAAGRVRRSRRPGNRQEAGSG